MLERHDTLECLNQTSPLREKLVKTHMVLNNHLPFIKRIAVAIYDPKTSVLKTYLHSSGKEDPLSHYQATIKDTPSLEALMKQGNPRIIKNKVTVERGRHEHTQRIGREGYAASYTLPMFYNGVFFGFIFFNSSETDAFNETTLEQLDLYGHLISLMVINEINSVQTLVAAISTASHMTHLRDPETGSHLDRMSRYARLIAKSLAEQYQLDDEYIERVFMFSPLHDIGKLGIPDQILLKPGKLTEEEQTIMRTHATKGREMIDNMLANFGFDSIPDVDILRNIAQFHHESINGQGYPAGLSGNSIPLEARIVAVADVFDALTSRRPYKEAWSNQEAFVMLERMSGEKLDTDCVKALIDQQEEIEQIQEQFKEDPLG
ncbi:MAG: HD domain-containing protein [Nitrosomonas sp.]